MGVPPAIRQIHFARCHRQTLENKSVSRGAAMPIAVAGRSTSASSGLISRESS
jgi:hypothetical protein